jgi:hypothetical protein
MVEGSWPGSSAPAFAASQLRRGGPGSGKVALRADPVRACLSRAGRQQHSRAPDARRSDSDSAIAGPCRVAGICPEQRRSWGPAAAAAAGCVAERQTRDEACATTTRNRCSPLCDLRAGARGDRRLQRRHLRHQPASATPARATPRRARRSSRRGAAERGACPRGPRTRSAPSGRERGCRGARHSTCRRRARSRRGREC